MGLYPSIISGGTKTEYRAINDFSIGSESLKNSMTPVFPSCQEDMSPALLSENMPSSGPRPSKNIEHRPNNSQLQTLCKKINFFEIWQVLYTF